MDYFRPTSLNDALRLKGDGNRRYIAGGTDLLVQLKSGRVPPPEGLISLRRIPELNAIDVGPVTRIGALTPITDIVEHVTVAERFPVLVQALARLGSVQVRNTATMGGNLCNASPCANSAPPLLVLGARVESVGREGVREFPLDQMLVGPGETCLAPDEILTAILLDTPSPETRGIFLWKDRVKVDIALASVAVAIELEDDGLTCRSARIAAGAVGPVPMRLPDAEAEVVGHALTDDRIARCAERAREGVAPICDVRAGDEYRRHLVGVFVRRGLSALREGRAR